MKIVMSGASGSGKTTLAKEIAKQLNLPFIENSAGLIMLPEDKELLRKQFGYEGNWGQVGVINKSHDMPGFGFEFQKSILKARRGILMRHDNLVLDRSPLDALVFYLNQCVHNHHQVSTQDFINRVTYTMFTTGITHLIRIPLLNPSSTVEDNGSRCHNWFFQKKIDGLFDLALDLVLEARHKTFSGYKEISDTVGFRVTTWDWELRVAQTMEFIKTYSN